MKNVLTVDVDFIMEPCIKLYEKLVEADNPEHLWEKFSHLLEIDKHLSINNSNLKFITNLVLSKAKKVEDKINIVFVVNHDCILNYLVSDDNEGEKFDIYNIDHHHDINYGKFQVHMVDRHDVVGEGDWVWYLDKYELISKYVWISNNNSEPYEGPQLRAGFIRAIGDKQVCLDGINFDYIFVVKSPKWVPEKYSVVFDLLKDACSIISGMDIRVDNSVYCPGLESRPLRRKVE